MRTAIIAGATGLVGKALMYKLLESNEYSSVKILTRKTLQIKHPKLEQIATDFDKLALINEKVLATDAFCCLGTTIAKAGSEQAFLKVDKDYVLKFAQICSQNQVKTFSLVSSVGADDASSVFYLKTKGEVESALKLMKFEKINIFRPSVLLGNREELRLGEKIGSIFAIAFSPIMFGSLAKYKPVNATQVAFKMSILAKDAPSGLNEYSSDQILEA